MGVKGSPVGSRENVRSDEGVAVRELQRTGWRLSHGDVRALTSDLQGRLRQGNAKRAHSQEKVEQQKTVTRTSSLPKKDM